MVSLIITNNVIFINNYSTLQVYLYIIIVNIYYFK